MSRSGSRSARAARAATARSRRATTPAVRPAIPGRTFQLEEPPRGHIVCRVCGRIAQVPLASEEEALLELLADRRPKDWSVNRIAFSLTGACRSCREGRPT